MTAFVAFMDGAFGRLLRVLLGVGLIVYGLLVVGGASGTVIAVIGLLPIGLGLWGHCLAEPFVPRPHIAP
jgi:hypothetical protein